MTDDDRRWLDDPRNVTRIVGGLAVLCALALLADLFYPKHPFFSVERISRLLRRVRLCGQLRAGVGR